MKTNLIEIVIVILLGFIAWNQFTEKRADPNPVVIQPPAPVVIQQPGVQSSVPVNVGDLSNPVQQPVNVQPVVAGTNTPGPTLNEYMGLPEGGNPFTGETP
jgi:hypothetical protein